MPADRKVTTSPSNEIKKEGNVPVSDQPKSVSYKMNPHHGSKKMVKKTGGKSKSKIISFIVQKNGAYFITSDDVGPFNDVGYCSVPRDYPRQIQKRVNTIISEPDSAKREELVKETINYSHRVTGCGSPFDKEMYDKSQASVAAGTAQSIFNKGSLTVIDTEDDDDESMEDK